jgi:enoyl-CoA hydratase/carnithine racemase
VPGAVETTLEDGGVALLLLNRPEARNALSPEMMEQLAAELERLDPDPEVRCAVIAGSEKVFAAGADIKAMSERSFAEALRHPAASFWRRLVAIKTPLIAAVSGYALGGGCELALACDMVVASETAVFGQPEITLGIIPGGGGTQRLARTIGKQRAMEYVLTGKQAVLAAEETGLSAGLESERRLYELAMATEDRVEGMRAFLEKREPKFEGR